MCKILFCVLKIYKKISIYETTTTLLINYTPMQNKNFVYIYIYTHTHTHTHIYIYIYIHIKESETVAQMEPLLLWTENKFMK